MTLDLTPRQVKALASFLDSGLSIVGIVLEGDPDFGPLMRIDAKVRALIKALPK